MESEIGEPMVRGPRNGVWTVEAVHSDGSSRWLIPAMRWVGWEEWKYMKRDESFFVSEVEAKEALAAALASGGQAGKGN